jgi:NAD(P)-dependent dehydrogenase (short-subunit alcohol dehydrogenase family)
MAQAPLERLKVDEWDRMVDINLKGVRSGYDIVAALQQQKSGHFSNVSSMPGHKVGPGFAVYADQACCAGTLRTPAPESEAPQHSHDGDRQGAVATELPNSVTDPECRRENSQVLRRVAIPARQEL